MTDFDFWVCDECGRPRPASEEQHAVKVQQRSERVYGTDRMHRPVDALVICDMCFDLLWSRGKQ